MSSNRFFSLDSPKAVKAQAFGYLNAINYMAPANTAGVGNLCPHASAGCLALCLGWYSGQAGMLSNAELETGTNATRASRVRKARMFMKDRSAFFVQMIAGIRSAQKIAQRRALKLCIRLNGATDIAWERIKLLEWEGRDAHHSIVELFPEVQFVDYTKSVKRALRAATDPTWPANYHLTFSRSETNWDDCIRVLTAGGNVAVVFERKPEALYRGWTVIDGDEHDLRHLDHSGGERKSLIVALSPKGRKAKADTSGFVVRN